MEDAIFLIVCFKEASSFYYFLDMSTMDKLKKLNLNVLRESRDLHKYLYRRIRRIANTLFDSKSLLSVKETRKKFSFYKIM